MGSGRYTPNSFWARVDKSGGPIACWMWQGGVFNHGYGRCYWMGKRDQAHRVAYLIAHRKIPEGLFVLHRCDVPLCVNPAHLFLGTNQDNMDDMVAKGRQRHIVRSMPGELNPNVKLTADKVKEVRRLSQLLGNLREVSRRTGVPYSNVWRIARGKSWKHI